MEKIEKSNINISVNGIVIADAPEERNERHTEELQEIITKVPNWITRWGIMLFFGILLIAAAISIVIHYPDTIKTGLKIETVNTSAPVINNIPDKIAKLLVKSGQLVKKGQPLAYIDGIDPTVPETVLAAPMDGRIAFVAIVQQGYFLRANQEVFQILPVNQQFFATLQVPKTEINKIKQGQNVLIRLTNYPVEEYGPLKGKITYISDEPSREGLFAIKVEFDIAALERKNIKLKNWMTGSAEIITEDVSVLSRVYHSIVKAIK
jgi:multidrug efflux pump subunit AcrA (membrane-fusion protein)